MNKKITFYKGDERRPRQVDVRSNPQTAYPAGKNSNFNVNFHYFCQPFDDASRKR
jgi:hypothetical protein